MNKVAVVYWSSTGNTEMMAKAIADGAKEAGAEVALLETSAFSASQMNEYDVIAFGCPAMGDEVLEEDEFEPMFTSCESQLAGKKIALFGSYGWGSGEWMEEWEKRSKEDGAELVTECLIIQEEPDDEGIEKCQVFGKTLA